MLRDYKFGRLNFNRIKIKNKQWNPPRSAVQEKNASTAKTATVDPTASAKRDSASAATPRLADHASLAASVKPTAAATTATAAKKLPNDYS